MNAPSKPSGFVKRTVEIVLSLRARALEAFPVTSILPAGGIAERPPVGKLIYAGSTIVAVGVVGFFLWSVSAAISSAAIAPGVVQVDSNRKTIQHVDGGIIAKLMVKEGDQVNAGQIMLVLDGAEVKTQTELLESRLISLLAQESRLLSEQADKSEITWLAALSQFMGRPGYDEAISGQTRIFKSRSRADVGEVSLRESRISQTKGQIQSLSRQVETATRELKSLQEDLRRSEKLLEEGYATAAQVQSLRRDEAQMQLRIDEMKGRIDTATKEISAGEISIGNIETARIKEIDEEMRAVQPERADAFEKYTLNRLRLERLNVVSPVTGRVLNLKYLSAGGVIPPGGAILDVVPENDLLVIEARIDPLDIDVVRPGLGAEIRLSALKARTTPSLKGAVVNVSADAISDKQTGQPYYLARVEIAPGELELIDAKQLYPGMPAEVVIVTGERTFLEYLLSPLEDSFGRAFREQ
ncbi:MAG: HlyD family type I secretion periplasmic adaptor subunit [Rhodospirillaceae bacterium]|nr:HlyD family type I secretion periplasmic adaptor subunit [Rhodospirillaceae bacterium]